MDSLTNIMGCTLAQLLNTLSLFMCSNNNGKTFLSAVHFPTETVISQLKHEIQLGSITSPQALEHLTQAVSILENVQSDKLTSLRPDSQDVPNIAELMSSTDELVNNFDQNAQKQRQAVEMVSGLSQEAPQEEPVLERPPLASQVNTDRKKRDVNDISPSSDCALAKLATTFCSPTDTAKALETLVNTYATSLSNLEKSRHVLLNDIIQAQSCSTPGVTGNQLAWASLGTSERMLVGVLSEVLGASKIAQDKVNEDSEKNGRMAAILSEFPGLLGSSMGQLSSAAGGMADLAKPANNQKTGGLFSFFGM